MSLGPPVWGSGTWGSATWGSGTWAGESSSTQRLVQCRAGIERAGASRTAYFTPNVVVTINGTARTASIQPDSLDVHLARNDEPSTASFTMNPGSTVPSVGQTVIIGLGTIANRRFAGQVIRVKHRRREGDLGTFIDVDAVDQTRLFNRRVINQTWRSTSATDIAADILSDWVTGFTGNGIQSGLPVIDVFQCVNEEPTTAFRRLVTAIAGGGFVITPDQDVRFFDLNGDRATGARTNPVALANTLTTLKDFSATYDATQQRTRVHVEGQGATLLLDYAGEPYIPVDYAWPFLPSATSYIRVEHNPPLFLNYAVRIAGSEGPYFCTTTADAVAGALSITVDDITSIYDHTLVTSGIGAAMLTDDKGHVIHGTITTLDPTQILVGLGLSRGTTFGALLTDLPAGSTLRLCDFLAVADTGGIYPVTAAGGQVFVHEVFDNTTEQTALAAIEGGDGIHEHVVNAPQADYVEAAALAQAELDAFSDADGLLEAEWVTTDMNAVPGTQQVINFTGTDALSATLTITSVDLSFPIQDYPPFRRCKAANVKLPEWLDTVRDAITKG